MLFVVIFIVCCDGSIIYARPGKNGLIWKKIPRGRTPPGEFNTYKLPGVVTFVNEIWAFGGSEKPGGNSPSGSRVA